MHNNTAAIARRFFAQALLALLIMSALMLVLAPHAVADTVTMKLVDGVWVADASAQPVIAFDVSWPLVIGLLVSTILPLAVGLVTKVTTSPGVRAVWLAALAAATGLLTELGQALTAGTVYNLGTGVLLALVSFLTAVGIHFGLLKPTGASAAAVRVGSRPLNR